MLRLTHDLITSTLPLPITSLQAAHSHELTAKETVLTLRLGACCSPINNVLPAVIFHATQLTSS